MQFNKIKPATSKAYVYVKFKQIGVNLRKTIIKFFYIY